MYTIEYMGTYCLLQLILQELYSVTGKEKQRGLNISGNDSECLF